MVMVMELVDDVVFSKGGGETKRFGIRAKATQWSDPIDAMFWHRAGMWGLSRGSR